MKKVNCILLIDDNEATNYIHKMVLNRLDCANEIIAVSSGFDALEYLMGIDTKNNTVPNLIFLDINMPAMNGWEFLEEYDQLPESQKGGIIMVMLTTSLNPDDEQKAKEIHNIKGYLNKPLNAEKMKELISQYF